LPCVVLHDGSPVEAGEEITVIGNPGLGEMLLTHTMTTGIVSNPERELNGQRYIQTSAAINPGNSGGPMFDSHGRVVGVVSLKGQIEGAGFAVRSKEVREFLLKLTPASKPVAKP
jgi:S1-C subfamily serine protease